MVTNHLDTFYINSKFDSWITVAVIIENLIFAGCNEGSICLYKLNQEVHYSNFYIISKTCINNCTYYFIYLYNTIFNFIYINLKLLI